MSLPEFLSGRELRLPNPLGLRLARSVAIAEFAEYQHQARPVAHMYLNAIAALAAEPMTEISLKVLRTAKRVSKRPLRLPARWAIVLPSNDCR